MHLFSHTYPGRVMYMPVKDCCDITDYPPVSPAEVDDLIYMLKTSMIEISDSHLSRLKYGYGCICDETDKFLKLNTYLKVLERHYYYVLNGYIGCLCPEELQSLIEEVKDLSQDVCVSYPSFHSSNNSVGPVRSSVGREDLIVDNSGFADWKAANPLQIAKEPYERCAQDVCNIIGFNLMAQSAYQSREAAKADPSVLDKTFNTSSSKAGNNLKVDPSGVPDGPVWKDGLPQQTFNMTGSSQDNFEVLSNMSLEKKVFDILFDIGSKKLHCDILAAVSVYRDYGTRTALPPTDVDYRMLIKKTDCDLDYKTYQKLVCDHNISVGLVQKFYECDVKIKMNKEGTCPVIETKFNKEYSLCDAGFTSILTKETCHTIEATIKADIEGCWKALELQANNQYKPAVTVTAKKITDDEQC